MFTRQKEILLAPAPYAGMAYDGERFYFTQAGAGKIYGFDRRFVPTGCFDPRRSYEHLCYDPREHCFWASCPQVRAMVFRLDSHFQETACFPLSLPRHGADPGYVTGITYDGDRGRPVVALASCLMGLQKKPGEESLLLERTDGEWISGVLAVHPYLLCIGCTAGRRSLRVYAGGGEQVGEYPLSQDDALVSAVLISPEEKGGELHAAVLVTRNRRSSWIWDCILSPEAREPPALPLPVTPCRKAPLSCPGDAPDGLCGSDALDCIAQVERALSRLLTLEGEKQQKILASSCHPNEILAANRSVRHTIVQITYLEQILYELLAEMETSLDEAGGAAPPIH